MVAAINSMPEFVSEVNSSEYTAIDFWADWCGPCKVISPVFDRMESEYPGVHFRKVDVDEQEQISAAVGIRAMPTFMLFKDGKLVDQLVGANPAALKKLLAKTA